MGKQDEEGSDEKGGGFAEGYGDVDSAELSALLAADEEFNASLDLAKIVAEDELNSPAITTTEKPTIVRAESVKDDSGRKGQLTAPKLRPVANKYRPKLSKTTIDLPIEEEEEESESPEASEKAESNAGVALLSAAIAQVDEI